MTEKYTKLPIEEIRKHFDGYFVENEMIAPYTSTKIGGKVELILFADSSSQLESMVSFLWENQLKFLMIGGGSNMLFAEKGLPQICLINRANNVNIDKVSNPPTLTAGSGALMTTITQTALENDLGGLEWAASLPGTFGGAIYGNAGAFGGELCDNLIMAKILHPIKGTITWTCQEMGFGYRSSILKRGTENVVILEGTLQLTHSDRETIAAEMQKNRTKRYKKQPPGACSGSMFKNPEGNYAGKLIEEAGLKGFVKGDVVISEKHANFFVNQGQGTAEDYKYLIELCKQKVLDNSGVQLELEVELIGDWS